MAFSDNVGCRETMVDPSTWNDICHIGRGRLRVLTPWSAPAPIKKNDGYNGGLLDDEAARRPKTPGSAKICV